MKSKPPRFENDRLKRGVLGAGREVPADLMVSKSAVLEIGAHPQYVNPIEVVDDDVVRLKFMKLVRFSGGETYDLG